MEDFIGFLIFIAFVGFSLFKRFSQAQQQRREPERPMPRPRRQMPEGVPPYPTPAWPPPPLESPRTLRMPAPAKPSPPVIAEEGVGSEGVSSEGYGIEGPQEMDSVSAELKQFDADAARLQRQNLQELRPDVAEVVPQRQLHQLKPSGSAELPDVVEPESGYDVRAALADRSSVAQAVVLAEVLGRPKAYRGRGFGRK